MESFKGKSLVEVYNRITQAKNNRLDEAGMMLGPGFVNEFEDTGMDAEMNNDYNVKPWKIIDDFYRGNVSSDELVNFSRETGKDIASISELEMFLNNKFMIGWKASDMGIPESDIVMKTRELIDILQNS